MIIDSDILIWYFRGNEKAKQLIDSTSKISISAVSYMELMQGMKNKAELFAFERFLKSKKIKIVELDKKISAMASNFVREYVLSDSLEMADALIAATCIRKKDILCTGNNKHFKCISDLKINIFKP